MVSCVLVSVWSCSGPQGECGNSVREEISLSGDWEYLRGPYDQHGEWQSVVVPHDWAIYGPFDRANDLQNVTVWQNGEQEDSWKTGRTGGLPYMGEGHYRRSFTLENIDNRHYTLLVDGAMSEPQVWVNDWLVGEWKYGYTPFHLDITEAIREGENSIRIDLRNLEQSSRWYPGAGLYRNLRIIATDQTHIPVWGTCITTREVGDQGAVVGVEVEVVGDQQGVEVLTFIYDHKGRKVAEGVGCSVELRVENPALWSPESPTLYTALTELRRAEETIDSYRTTFGIRTIELRPDEGFFLNGTKRKFRGVCEHHDLGALGAAVNRSAIRHRLEILKDMGVDAIRTAHNMPAPELVELCDSMGFMLIVESFDEWDGAKCANGYHRFFDEWAERDMVNMIRAFRNNASVVMWSVGNEVPTQWLPEGVERAGWLVDICRREDPTRPVTCGMDQFDAVIHNGFADQFDVPGFNYKVHRYQEAYDALSQKLVLGSESASTVSSRGVYKIPAEPRKNILYDDHHSSAYDTEACYWSDIPDYDFRADDDIEWCIGQFVWTGFDYLGEPSPYDTDAWPNHSSMFGIIDLATIPKDRFWLYRSQWNREEATLHLLPHWNWAGCEGQLIPVMAYTSYDSAELFLNGKSMGVRHKHADGDIMERYRLIWEVPYEAGEIEVVAFDSEGRRAAKCSRETAGEAVRLCAEVSHTTIEAHPDELAFVTIYAVDAKGVDVPTADFEVALSVEGSGRFRAVANGDPTSLELFHEPHMHLFSGKLCAIVQSSGERGKIRVTASAEGVESATVTIKAR